MAGPMLALPAPPPPPAIQFGMHSLICRVMIDNAIADGSHAALHSLMNIEKRGALGSAAMHTLKEEWSAGQLARAKERYAENHFKNWYYATVDAPGVIPWGAGQSNATRVATTGCCLCFRYLCEKKIIKVEGFFPTRRSFLIIAAAAENWRAVQYIVEEIPEQWMFHGQDINAALVGALAGAGNPPGEHSIMNFVSGREAILRKLVARMQAFEEAHPARFWARVAESVGAQNNLRGGEMGLTFDSQLNISKYIDVDLAKQLFLWGMHPGSWGFVAGRRNIVSQMLQFKNPHRCSVLRWLDHMPFRGGMSADVINEPICPQGMGIPDFYPPWGVAMWLGDTAAAVTLSQLRYIKPVAFGRPGPDYTGVSSFAYLPGRAAVENFTPTHLRLLTHWLRCAAWDMERDDMVIEVTVMLENLLDHIENRRFDLKTAAVPAGVDAVTFRAAMKRQVNEETDVVVCMVRVIIGIPFRSIEGDPDSMELTRRTSILEDDDYVEWIAQVKRNKREFRWYKDCVAVLAALERPPDTRSLRSMTEQVMDWE